METLEVTRTVKVHEIQFGRNPRRKFDDAAMYELEESIRAQSLLQPILVRPVGDAYEIIAGERRYRAFTKVFGQDAEIPVYVKVMTDAEVDAAALTENIVRKGMTPVEEAESAAKVLGDCKGDRVEAAKRLGWSQATLDKRLSLMYATDSVRVALQDGKILLGHAELLAVCRKETQESALAMLTKGEKPMTVDAFKVVINNAALMLDSAIFNKDDCATCIQNSGNQSALFSEVITGGRCTNKQCYEAKTEGELNRRADALKEEFQVVRIARPGENFTVIPLAASGLKGVGTEQAQACRSCKSFGAAVSASPDKLGMTFKNLCMDVPCNTKMVAKRVEDERQAAVLVAKKMEEQAAAAKGENPEQAATAPTTGASGVQGDAIKPTKKVDAKTKAPAKVVYPEPSNRVKEYREALWRAIYKRVVMGLQARDNRAVLLAMCLTQPSKLDAAALRSDLAAVVPDVGASTSFAKVLEALLSVDSIQLGQAMTAVAANVSSTSMGFDIKDVVSTLKSFDVKLADHWKVCKDFLEQLTKNEIDAVADEIGIAEAMGKDYAKARSQGKEDFINSVLAVKDFDYQGKVPKLISW